MDARAGEVRARVDRGSGASGRVGDGALSSPGGRRPHRPGSGRQPARLHRPERALIRPRLARQYERPATRAHRRRRRGSSVDSLDRRADDATRCEPLALGSGCSCRDDPRRHGRGLGRRGRGRRAGLRPPDPRLRRAARAVLAARRSSEARHREARNAHPPGHLRREQRRQAVARLLVPLSRRLALVQLQDGRPDRPLRAGAGVPVQAQGARRELRHGRAHARAWCASVTATRRR